MRCECGDRSHGASPEGNACVCVLGRAVTAGAAQVSRHGSVGVCSLRCLSQTATAGAHLPSRWGGGRVMCTSLPLATACLAWPHAGDVLSLSLTHPPHTHTHANTRTTNRTHMQTHANTHTHSHAHACGSRPYHLTLRNTPHRAPLSRHSLAACSAPFAGPPSAVRSDASRNV